MIQRSIFKKIFTSVTLLTVQLLNFSACSRNEVNIKPLSESPSKIYGDLFSFVQENSVFEDSKYFADAIPKKNISQILDNWKNIDKQDKNKILDFLNDNFILPDLIKEEDNPKAENLNDYITKMWDQLVREPKPQIENDTLIALPEKYIVPGGRFREIYYWDSYFSMLGLATSNKWDLVESMINDFDFLIQNYGHIPNGNRIYYLSRSQPPFFSLMVQLLAEHSGDYIYTKYKDSLIKEYAYWMKREVNNPQNEQLRTVKLENGQILNRYWDESNTPREEAWKEDLKTANEANIKFKRDKNEVYRDLRAAAASGWDFSSRWLEDESNLSTIKTTKIIPIDLNALLYNLELTIEKAFSIEGNINKAQDYAYKAMIRKNAIKKYLISENGIFYDYDLDKKSVTNKITPASLFPAYLDMDLTENSEKTFEAVKSNLVTPIGILTTKNNKSGLQWDSPNVWAPLQLISLRASINLGETDFAYSLAKRFVKNASKEFSNSGYLFEKYVFNGSQRDGGGEYKNQIGFGWTNASLIYILRTMCQNDLPCLNEL